MSHLVWQAVSGGQAGKGIIVFSCLLGLLVGCAPVISPEVMNRVEQGLTYGVLTADPEAYQGKMVLWGGVIAQATPKTGETELEIVQKNLTGNYRPEDGDVSLGRFLVIYPGFLDPDIYKADRQVTVAGEVKGSEVRKLGEADYRYPVITAQELYLWPQPRPQMAYPGWGFYPYYYFAPYYFGPYYGDYPWLWP